MADPFDAIVISSDSTIRAAMEAISANSREVVLVRDDAGRIVGLITDGDIRRGLLRGLTLASPAADVMTRDFVSVAPGIDRAAVLDLMKARDHPSRPGARRRTAAGRDSFPARSDRHVRQGQTSRS